MKILKSIGLILLVLLLLVSIVSASNHTVAFWRLIKGDKTSPYLYMYEDFSNVTWTVRDGTKKEYISSSNVRVMPFEGSFSTEGEYLTLFVKADSSGYPFIKVPFDKSKAQENLVINKLSYFVVTYDIWSETVPPYNIVMKNVVNDEDGKNITDYDGLYLKHQKKYCASNSGSILTSLGNDISMSSCSDGDKICCVLAVNFDDVSKSTVSYYVNGIENELSYSFAFTSDSEYISYYDFSLSSTYDCSISIDNFSVYAFDREFKGDIKDVLKEVNYK